MSLEPIDQPMHRPIDLPILQDRAFMLRKARDFFYERNIIEVDCQALQPYPAIDANIEVIEAEAAIGFIGYLHTSPEYQLKRLLSAGAKDLYCLGHVFRKNDLGSRHEPEFTMAEWYRIGFSFEEMIDETVEFLFLFLQGCPVEIFPYQEIFLRYAKIDPQQISLSDLQSLVTMHGGDLWDRTTSLQFLFSHLIEPKLGKDQLTVVIDFPAEEAALARIVEKGNEKVAKRFEIFSDGIELANGYHELNDEIELRRRFEQENAKREKEGKKRYLLDEAFLEAMNGNFPDCCGVSVGFDRVLMLRHKKKTLNAVIATSAQWGQFSPFQKLSLSLSVQ